MRAFVLLVSFLVGFGGVVRAADDTSQGVIRAQIEAFERDDAAAAYEFAAPGIRQLFPDAAAFMAMVREKYAPIYRHKSFEFTASQTAEGLTLQRVDIVDNEGLAWAAVYTLQPQPDGSLKIVGCTLVRAGQAV